LNQKESHIFYMHEALAQAKLAQEIDEVPVGAIVVKNSKIIGSGFNQNIQLNSVAAHAEIVAINNASNYLNNLRLVNCDIYVTLEPCHMCAKAIVDARFRNLYFATIEPKTGAIISKDFFLDKDFLNHKVNYEYGFLQNESSEMLKNFFLSKRT
jgi:tRNA(adenine34) deaminase